jgi:hypothetical protein
MTQTFAFVKTYVVLALFLASSLFADDIVVDNAG